MRAHVVVVLVVAAACGSRAAAPVPVVNQTPPPDATTCPTAAADAEVRHGGAVPDDPIDLDGDGVGELVFRDDCFDGCRFLVYLAPVGGCARFLGEVEGMSGPYCVGPGTADQPCRLGIVQEMIHGDSQELFYEVVDGTYQYVEAGRYWPDDEP